MHLDSHLQYKSKPLDVVKTIFNMRRELFSINTPQHWYSVRVHITSHDCVLIQNLPGSIGLSRYP
jgi:hypothetical protein